jgi:hypothetical protein
MLGCPKESSGAIFLNPGITVDTICFYVWIQDA